MTGGDAMTDPGDDGVSGVRAALSDLLPVLLPGARYEPTTDEVMIAVQDGRARVSVDSLVRTAAQQASTAWPRLVEAWCTAVLEQLHLPIPAIDAEGLRVRLVPRHDVDPEQLIVRPYGAYFQLELMMDLPQRRIWVGPGQAGELGLGAAAAFDAGLRNTIQRELATLGTRRHEIGPGLSIDVAAADDNPWVSVGLTSITNLFRIESMPYGALVAVPRLSTVMCHVVASDQVLGDVQVVGRLVADMHRDAIDPCSPELFWFHGGALYPIRRGDGAKVTLPVELQPLIASLPSHPIEG
ncbi:MAG: hypothetical protein ACK5OX_14405 [Desertimonas sp.]